MRTANGGGSEARWSDEQIKDALIACRGNITGTARSLYYDANTLRTRIRKSEMLQAVRDELKAQLIDRAVSIIEDKLDSDDEHVQLKAATFILRTQGRSEGWGDTAAITNGDNGALTITIKREGD